MVVSSVIRKRDGTPSTVIKVTFENQARTVRCATYLRAYLGPYPDTPRANLENIDQDTSGICVVKCDFGLK